MGGRDKTDRRGLGEIVQGEVVNMCNPVTIKEKLGV